jgi:hypothetical protein
MSVKRLSPQGSLFEAKGYFGVALEKQKSAGVFLFFEEFDVSVENRTAKCPAGQVAGNFSRITNAKTGKVECRIEWKDSVCQACKKKCECLGKGQTHRMVRVGEHHDRVQARRREQAREEFKREMKRRNGIEGTISELTRGYGLRHCRYRGRAKTRLQNLFMGAACNIKRWFRRTAWEARRAAELVASGAAPAFGPATG